MFGVFARLIGGAMSPLVDQVTAYGASLLRKLALFLVAAVCLLVVILTLTLAFGFWVSSLAGPVAGALAVAALYLLVAALAVFLALRDGRRDPAAEEHPSHAGEQTGSARSETIDQFTAPILSLLQGLGLRREQIAVLAGSSLAKQMRPVPLVGVAIVAGFLVGRMWRGWDALLSSDVVESVLDLLMPNRREEDSDGLGEAASRPE